LLLNLSSSTSKLNNDRNIIHILLRYLAYPDGFIVYLTSVLLSNLFYKENAVPEDYYLQKSISQIKNSDIKIFSVFSSFLEGFLKKGDQKEIQTITHLSTLNINLPSSFPFISLFNPNVLCMECAICYILQSLNIIVLENPSSLVLHLLKQTQILEVMKAFLEETLFFDGVGEEIIKHTFVHSIFWSYMSQNVNGTVVDIQDSILSVIEKLVCCEYETLKWVMDGDIVSAVVKMIDRCVRAVKGKGVMYVYIFVCVCCLFCVYLFVLYACEFCVYVYLIVQLILFYNF
jgi:hypothetical protein